MKGADDVDARAASDCRLPVVVKVVSPDILHKSDAGGVKVNLQQRGRSARGDTRDGRAAEDQKRAQSTAG